MQRPSGALNALLNFAPGSPPPKPKGQPTTSSTTECSCDGRGVVYVLRRTTIAKRGFVLNVRPCCACAKGLNQHGRHGEVCRWATWTRKRCGICGANPDATIPADWDGTAPGRALTTAEVLAFGTGKDNDPIKLYGEIA